MLLLVFSAISSAIYSTSFNSSYKTTLGNLVGCTTFILMAVFIGSEFISNYYKSIKFYIFKLFLKDVEI